MEIRVLQKHKLLVIKMLTKRQQFRILKQVKNGIKDREEEAKITVILKMMTVLILMMDHLRMGTKWLTKDKRLIMQKIARIVLKVQTLRLMAQKEDNKREKKLYLLLPNQK